MLWWLSQPIWIKTHLEQWFACSKCLINISYYNLKLLFVASMTPWVPAPSLLVLKCYLVITHMYTHPQSVWLNNKAHDDFFILLLPFHVIHGTFKSSKKNASHMPQATAPMTFTRALGNDPYPALFLSAVTKLQAFGWLCVVIWACLAPSLVPVGIVNPFICFSCYNFYWYVRVILKESTRGTYSPIYNTLISSIFIFYIKEIQTPSVKFSRIL